MSGASDGVIHGQTMDAQGRCVHYGTALDVVAIEFACCGRFYACHLCHEEAESHPARQWPIAERRREAVLCGACRSTLSISRYLAVLACPNCGAPFNEGCRLHTHLYFAVE